MSRNGGCREYDRLERRLRSRVSRRAFLVRGGLTVAALGAIPTWLARAAAAATSGSPSVRRAGKRGKVLVVVFQRGAMDGLNAVVPFAEAAYYAARPGIAVPAPARAAGAGAALDLDGAFALHPALAPLLPWYRRRRLAVVHAAGLPFSTRSHFDAQDFMESGTPGLKGTPDGWLNRYLGEAPPAASSPFRAVSLTAETPRTMRGDAGVLAVENLDALARAGGEPKRGALAGSFETLYAASVDTYLHGAGKELFDAARAVAGLSAPADSGAPYPKGGLGDKLRQIARLIKSDVGLEVAFAEVGGWDHHANEGGAQGQLAYRLRDFGGALAAFATDLGDRLADVVLVTMSEFGRTVRENGNAGTDHGYGNVMFVLGGEVRGGKVRGRWPGLAPEKLFEGRDLDVTTDYRAVLAETLRHHLGARNLDAAFPGFTPAGKLGLFA